VTDESSESVFVHERPENCPECNGDLEPQGDHGQMQCDETREHQYTWATYESVDGELVHELVSGNEVFARVN